MNNRRDAYLREMETRLRHLPQSDRVEEIAEVTQHLDTLIAACQSEGKTEADAVDEAIARFGAAREIGSRLYHADKHKRFVPLIEPGLFYIVFSSLVGFAEQGFCATLNAATYGLALRGAMPEAMAQTFLQIVRPRSFLMGPYGWALQLSLFFASAAVLLARYGLRGAMEKARQSPPVNAVLRCVMIAYLLGGFSLRAWYHAFAVVMHRAAGTMPVGVSVASNITPFVFGFLAAYLVGRTNRSRESIADAVGCAAFVGAVVGVVQGLFQFLPTSLGEIGYPSSIYTIPVFLYVIALSVAFGAAGVFIAYFGVLLGEKSRRVIPPSVKQIVAQNL